MNRSLQRFCSWCGIATAFLFFGGFVIAGFFPPPAPSLSPEEIAAIYRAHQQSILAGMMVWMASGVTMCLLIGVIAGQMRRIPGAPAALCYTQIAAGALNTVFFVVPPTLIIVTAYRIDRAAELTHLMNDFSWIMAVLPWPGATAQCLAIGLAILADTGDRPLFPRWIGFYNVFTAVSFLVATFLIFVTSGPFAWNSVFPFWFAGTIFFVWFFVMHVGLLRAIDREDVAA